MCQIQAGLLKPTDIILIHDDIIATGGTAQAAIDIAMAAGVLPENIYMSFICAIPYLTGMSTLKNYKEIFCLISKWSDSFLVAPFIYTYELSSSLSTLFMYFKSFSQDF